MVFLVLSSLIFFLVSQTSVCLAESDQLTALVQRLESLENELRELKATCSLPQNHYDAKRLQPGTDAAFSAVLDSHSQNTASHTEPIKYDHVYTNIGNGYNNSSGIFNPPASGLYQLYASVAVDGDAAVHAFLEKNGQALCAMTATHYSTGSCMVVVRLDEGDKVWVREAFGSLVRGAKLSAFVGIRLA